MNGFRKTLSAAVALATLAFAQVATACPTCGNSIEHSGGNLAEGFYWSILFMMSMPFVILGGLSLLFWLEIRKARRAANASAADVRRNLSQPANAAP
jgi:hypothetical protein